MEHDSTSSSSAETAEHLIRLAAEFASAVQAANDVQSDNPIGFFLFWGQCNADNPNQFIGNAQAQMSPSALMAFYDYIGKLSHKATDDYTRKFMELLSDAIDAPTSDQTDSD